MSLTIEEMDEINVLLTEVSLELLGNRFYDIHGQAHDSLRELYLPNIKVKNNYDPDKSELMLELMRTETQTTSPSPTNVRQESGGNSHRRPTNLISLKEAKHPAKHRPTVNDKDVPEVTSERLLPSPIDLVETEIKNNVAKGKWTN